MTDEKPAGQHRAVLKSARVVSLATLLSRVLGMVRDMAMGWVLISGARDALILAWTLPNLFRRLFGEGALGSALIPTFSAALKEEGRGAALRLGLGVVRILALFLLVVLGLAYLGTWASPESWWVDLFTANGAASPDDLTPETKGEMTRHLLWIFLPYLLLICVMAQLAGMLNCLGKFLVPAIAPALLNIIWILGLALVAWIPNLTDYQQTTTLAAFIVFGGVLQLGLAIRDLRASEKWPRAATWSEPRVRKVFALMSPLLLGLAASQINTLVDRGIATKFIEGDGAVSNLYYGFRITQLPLGLIGIAVSTAAFPHFARLAQEGDQATLASSLFDSIRSALFLSLPAAVGGVLLASPIMELIFMRGAFTQENADASAAALWGYGLGIPCLTASMLLIKASYSLHRYRLALMVTLATVVVNIAASLSLVGGMAETGIALATSIAALFQTAILLPRFVAANPQAARRCMVEFLRGALACAVMAGAIVGVLYVLGLWLEGSLSLWARGLRLAVPMAVGIVAFLGAARFLCPDRFTELVQLTRRD